MGLVRFGSLLFPRRESFVITIIYELSSSFDPPMDSRRLVHSPVGHFPPPTGAAAVADGSAVNSTKPASGAYST